jgi:nucleotide-binding universal stress UspA family protein
MNRSEILVPLDGSPLADAALPYAETIAGATGASLRLLGVVERESAGLQNWPDAVRTYVETVRLDSLTQHLVTTAAAVSERGVPAESAVVIGDPADEILAAADTPGVTTVVMATRGRGGIQRLFIGSVADKVMRHAARPTLLISPSEAHGEKAAVSLRRIMVPLDGSPLAETALPRAIELAAATGALVTLVRVEPFVTAGSAPYGAVVDFARIEEEVGAAAGAYLEKVAGQFPASLQVETAVLRGFSAATLIEFATHEAVDLVVMTTHGRGGLRRLALGSTADRMVRSGVPVLLLRPLAPQAASAPGEPAYRCANCARPITILRGPDDQCPRCAKHLHTCANCVFWDTTGCVLQRTEAYTVVWPGRGCPRFTFRATPSPAEAPRLVELSDVR